MKPEQRQSLRHIIRSPKLLGIELLAGIVVALALIPEAIAFSVIAGVDPAVGLFASFTMAVTISFVGGRPAMISAATAATALVIAPVMRDHGYDYLIATVLLAGVLQIVLAVLGVAKLMRFIPRSVMVGFVNALAILVLISQLPELIDVPWLVYLLVGLGLVIIFLWPLIRSSFTQNIPAPLIAIIVVTALVLIVGWDVPTVGDKGELPRTIPDLFFPNVPLNLETLQIIFPAALAMAVVGLLESLLTAKLVDDITDTRSNKTRESWGQGVANLVSGFFGGIGGCAVVGQTMMNVKVSGARSRLSTFTAGIMVLVFSMVLSDMVAQIPMAALVAVMIFVAYSAFDWHSVAISSLKMMPKSELLVMLVTVVLTVTTGNLAIGVLTGTLTAMVLFARRVAHFTSVERTIIEAEDGMRQAHYKVSGELFFASSNDLYTQFDYAGDPAHVVIDFSESHLWDASTVAALDSVMEKYKNRGTEVEIKGLNQASRRMRVRLAGRLNQ